MFSGISFPLFFWDGYKCTLSLWRNNLESSWKKQKKKRLGTDDLFTCMLRTVWRMRHVLVHFQFLQLPCSSTTENSELMKLSVGNFWIVVSHSQNQTATCRIKQIKENKQKISIHKENPSFVRLIPNWVALCLLKIFILYITREWTSYKFISNSSFKKVSLKILHLQIKSNRPKCNVNTHLLTIIKTNISSFSPFLIGELPRTF